MIAAAATNVRRLRISTPFLRGVKLRPGGSPRPPPERPTAKPTLRITTVTGKASQCASLVDVQVGVPAGGLQVPRRQPPGQLGEDVDGAV